ncbi:MAG: RNA 2',3'-cyclic phosphodiesterase [bacterium]|nr:RNA 2',3'-cyclic phosphodiesterase [bacterium]
MRLFVAVEIPGLIKEMMGELEGALPSDGLNKVDVKNMHITLKFLGEVDETKVEEIKAALSGVEFAPFKVQVRGVGVFPKEDYVKVIWAGTESAELKELAGKVEEALSGMFGGEARGFSGHLTLARVKRKVDLKEFLEKRREEVFGGFAVDKFLLMKSVLQPGGPEYSVVGEFGAKTSE